VLGAILTWLRDGGAATIGVLAALYVLIRDERRYRKDKRRSRADQARLVSVDAGLDSNFIQGEVAGEDIYIVSVEAENLSERPIFDVRFGRPNLDANSWRPYEGIEKVKAVSPGGSARILFAVETTCSMDDLDEFGSVPVHFTDAGGARWRRTANSQPIEVASLSWWDVSGGAKPSWSERLIGRLLSLLRRHPGPTEEHMGLF
jgi:hypothetical protein